MPGKIVIMDNLVTHKIDGIRESIEIKNTNFLDIPSYASNLNPIKMTSPKMK
ncbi:MAG: transposase [Sodalis sp. (in: enterobacteria)]